MTQIHADEEKRIATKEKSEHDDLEPIRKPRKEALKEKTTNFVIPAKAGIHLEFVRMDYGQNRAKTSCFRRYDKQAIGGFRIGS